MELPDGYVEKAYLFARRRVTGAYDAQDLAQEILVEVLDALKRGASPQNFNAWFYAIAHNRYARWAERKRRQRLRSQEVDLLWEPGVWQDPGDSVERSEEMNVLRHELSMLKKSYRDILLKYYFEDKKVGQIAEELHIPEGTVKRRLHEARKTLKEGVSAVPKENGRRSYFPDTLVLWAHGNPSSMWPYVKRQLPQNILSISAQRPVTLDELCGEIGLARVYMEEEVELLLEVTLLKKVGRDSYRADLIILDDEDVSRLEETIERVAYGLAEKAYLSLDAAQEKILSIGFHGTGFEWPFLRWLFILQLADSIGINIRKNAMKSVEADDLPKYEKPWFLHGIRQSST